MMRIRNTLIGCCLAAASMCVMADKVDKSDEHKDHHPERTTPLAETVKMQTDKAMNANKITAMDQQMMDMQSMHDKMAAAKTPEERQALMAKHMELMQEGMSMMKNMCDMAEMQADAGMKGSMVEQQQMMDKCMAMMKNSMDMMETMMPMMDGSGAVPAK